MTNPFTRDLHEQAALEGIAGLANTGRQLLEEDELHDKSRGLLFAPLQRQFDELVGRPRENDDWLLKMMDTHRDPWVLSVEKLIPKKGDFWYLAGPMTNIAKFNFPEFDRISEILRGQGYPIVSPAEFEHEADRAKCLLSETGADGDGGPTWQECLARDLVIVSHPRCVGIILIPNWWKSNGAKLETQTAEQLGKPLFEFIEDKMELVQIDRSAALRTYESQALLAAAREQFEASRADAASLTEWLRDRFNDTKAKG